MTRYLSQALGAVEPRFGHSIDELEQASGRPGADIRLSGENAHRLRTKLLELGLDPADTTGPELYNALHRRLEHDETVLRHALGISDDAEPSQVISRIRQFLHNYDAPRQCYSIKLSVMKRLLKKKTPKVVMKALGYRSVDSLLKHEPVAQVMALASLVESASWQRLFHAQYAQLQPSDFECRHISVLAPASERWVRAAAPLVTTARHNIITFKELGTIVILPMQAKVDGLALTTMLLVLHAFNDVRSYSSYVKLQQVKIDFGIIIRTTSLAEPFTSARLAGQPVPWRMIQQYYARFKNAYHAGVFEPHVQPEDLAWQPAEEVLVRLAPELSFWENTQYLCMLHDNQPVSLNVLDVALSYCNRLPFADRVVHFVRDHLWHELMMRYLNHANLEAAVTYQLGNELVPEQALAD